MTTPIDRGPGPLAAIAWCGLGGTLATAIGWVLIDSLAFWILVGALLTVSCPALVWYECRTTAAPPR